MNADCKHVESTRVGLHEVRQVRVQQEHQRAHTCHHESKDDGSTTQRRVQCGVFNNIEWLSEVSTIRTTYKGIQRYKESPYFWKLPTLFSICPKAYKTPLNPPASRRVQTWMYGD